MSRESMVFVFGFIVAIMPFMGIPRDIKTYFFVAFGTILVFLGASLRRSAYMRSISHESGELRADVFRESSARHSSKEQSLPKIETTRGL